MLSLPASTNAARGGSNADGREMVEALIGQFERDSSGMPVHLDSTVFINLRRRLVAVGRLLESQEEATSPGTLKSTSSRSQCKPPPRPTSLDGPDIAGGCVRELAIAPEDRIAFHMDRISLPLAKSQAIVHGHSGASGGAHDLTHGAPEREFSGVTVESYLTSEFPTLLVQRDRRDQTVSELGALGLPVFVRPVAAHRPPGDSSSCVCSQSAGRFAKRQLLAVVCAECGMFPCTART